MEIVKAENGLLCLFSLYHELQNNILVELSIQ